MPELRHGCPFKGSFNLSDFDLTQEASTYFPPTVVPGTYMFHTRVHTGNGNRTLVEQKFVFEIKMIQGNLMGFLLKKN